MYFFVIIPILYSCSDSNNEVSDNINQPVDGFEWTVPENTITGSFNPFPLAIDPTFRNASEIDFIAEESLVAMINFNEEIKVYPYQYLNRFESVNDKLSGRNYALTYCPITRSALCWDRDFKNNSMVLRASGYLLHDNLVAHDSNSDTYWSQIGAECIKGKYAGQTNKTYNFIETKWKYIKEYFPNALVFTNSSIANKSEITAKKNTDNVEIGDKVFGIIEKNPNGSTVIYGYTYNMFEEETKLYTKNILSKKTIIIGNSNLHYITSFIDDSNSEFTAIEDQYPIIMQDDKRNKWNIFGIAVSGNRQGNQLKSPTNFVALYWAWQAFYDTIIFEE